ncbi:MAG: methyltransferase domain-containing protein [Dehalococcoidia bacterium]
MTTEQLDQAKAEAFGGQMIGTLNGAALTFMVSIGHRTGLFDTMAGLAASTSHQIAEATRLNERYVREWLGAMVTGRIIDYDPAGQTYALPPEHAASLTRAAGPGNLGSFAQFFSEMGNVETGIVESFKNGGGVPYSGYPRFQELMREESAQVFDATLIDVTLPLVPGLVDRLKAGIDVADVGCGAGHAVNLMARAFPNSRFTGYDFSEEGVARGNAEAKELGVSNARFEVRDVATLEGSQQFDLITVFDAIHDQAQPRKVLMGIYESLRPGGVFLCVDIAASSNLEENLEHPLAPFLYTISTMHCMTVSLALDGEGLGTVWGEQQARELLAEAGFGAIEVKNVEGDILNNYYIAHKR